ncbi:cobalamin B12-binding domain-containing protein [Pseudonocardia halophobica]|uniref:cobalamin B12-binding domain-containing protein n=1 Tax=Pseudonocardia halophobica TaxID=29401 RepID=UPI003D93142C
MTAGSDPRVAACRAEFMAALGRADEDTAVAVALGLVDAGVAAREILLGLVAGTQEEVGLRWQRGEWSVAREHAATAVNERVVAALGRRTRRGSRGHVVLACLDGEWHALPGRIVAEVLRLAGWHVTFLGASVPAAGLVSYLHQEGPDVVAVSCALPMHLPAAHRTIVAAQRTGTPVLAGGPGFGADGRWARRLGVDAWAPDAVEAVRLLDEMPWPEPEPDQVGDGGPGPEYAGLRARRGDLVRAATRVLDGRTALGAPGGVVEAGLEDDLTHAVDFLTAAVYLSDPEVFTGYLGWLADLLDARGLGTGPARAVLAEFHTGLHDFPFAQECLRRGAAQLQDRPAVPTDGAATVREATA